MLRVDRREDRHCDRDASSAPAEVQFDDRTILDSDGLLLLNRIPHSVVVVGAGVIGIEYASMFAALGATVTVVEKRERLLDFCDVQITEGLQYHLRDVGVVFRMSEEVTAVKLHADGAVTELQAGSRSPPSSSCMRPVVRGRRMISISRLRVSRPISEVLSPSIPITGPLSSTSSRRATSSAGRRSRLRRWSKGASPRHTLLASPLRCAS